MLRCPNCPCNLEPIQHRGVQLDFCPQCRGVWFDEGELSTLQNRPPKLDHAMLLHLPALARTARCPRGDGRLQAVEFPEGSGCILSLCSCCLGVWLDHDTLAKVQTAAALRRKVEAEHHEHFEREVLRDQENAEPKFGAFLQWLTGLDPEIHSPVRRTPVATYGLIITIVLCYLGQQMLRSEYPGEAELYAALAMTPANIMQGTQLYTLFTSMFMHADIFHLLGNLWFLWIAGDNVEDRLGAGPYLLLYLATGLVADAVHIASDPTSTIPTLGASGAISGIIGAYVAFFPHRKFAVRIYLFLWYGFLLKIPSWLYFGFWFALQLAFAGMGVPGIAFWAHIGGFVAGWVVAVVMRHAPRFA